MTRMCAPDGQRRLSLIDDVAMENRRIDRHVRTRDRQKERDAGISMWSRCDRLNRNHPSAVGPTTPTISFVSNNGMLVTSPVGTNAAPRPNTVVVRPSTPDR